MAVPEDTGYPLQWFIQQEFVRSMFECAVCLEVVKDPVQVRDCGHQFCRYCLDGVLSTSMVLRSQVQPRCPSCQKDISPDMVFTDNGAKRVIDKQAVNCPNTGCEWKGQLCSYLKEHTERCEFLILSCSNMGCNVQVIRKDLDVHLAECEHRTVVCQYCNDKHAFKNKAEHLETCPYLPVECTNKCSEKGIPRNQMEEHLEKVCIKTVVKCKFLAVGCKYECECCNMEEHLNQGMNDHLELSTSKISGLEDKMFSLQEQHQMDIKKVREEIVAVHQKDIEKVRREIVVVHQKDIKRVKQEIAAVHQKDIEKLCQRSAVIITDFNRKFSEAKDSNTVGDIYGNPFLTSPLGYKIRMRVDLNETREECKDHMGAYVCLMKTDHDAILPWPFKKKCTFTLIDQQDDEKERKNVMMALTPAGEEQFKRPKNGRNGRGFATFVSHTTLRTRKYIKDDTVFITLDIEP